MPGPYPKWRPWKRNRIGRTKGFSSVRNPPPPSSIERSLQLRLPLKLGVEFWKVKSRVWRDLESRSRDIDFVVKFVIIIRGNCA